jgi:hypothetical protein
MVKLFELKFPYSIILLFLLLVPLVFSLGCGRKGHLHVNPEFSINLAIPDRKYPPVKKLSTSGREVYELYGRPDLVRLWWSKDGRIHRFLEVDRKLQDKKAIYRLRHSWIYLEKNLELIFATDGAYQEVPLNDKIRTICTYGDPEDIKSISEEKPIKEIWNYYSIGLILVFQEDKIIKEQRHNPMGAVIKR